MFLLFISWIDVIMTLRRYFFVEILSISLSANRIAIKKWIEREKNLQGSKKKYQNSTYAISLDERNNP